MEMLIVVAIIVILVAIAIPTFSGQLDKAKAATDDANLRAAKAVALNNDMTNSWADGLIEEEGTTTLYFDIDNAVFENANTNADHGQSSANSSKFITVTFTDGKMNNDIGWN